MYEQANFLRPNIPGLMRYKTFRCKPSTQNTSSTHFQAIRIAYKISLK